MKGVVNKVDLWECEGKGGTYMLLGTGIGAGKSKEYGDILIYQDIFSGQLFYRKPEDFNNRMIKL